MQRLSFRYWNKTGFVVLFFVLLSGCEDFIEEDLSDATIEILTPRDGLISSEVTQTFYWEPVEFALNYKVQIARPDFVFIDELVFDSTTSKNTLTVNFTPGLYTWRIKALNANSESPFYYRIFAIDSSGNLSGAQIVLSSPASNAYINQTDPVFSWEVLPGATQYSYKIYEGEFGNSNLATSEINGNATSLGLPISLSERSYEWGVRGENDQSNSPYSSRMLTVDITNPDVPNLTNPGNNIVTTNPTVVFSWSALGSGGAPEFDSLFISSDSTLSSLISSYESTSATFSDSLADGTYFWAVRRYDRAGNNSGLSEVRRITIQ